jgi:hypothetical protein
VEPRPHLPSAALRGAHVSRRAAARTFTGMAAGSAMALAAAPLLTVSQVLAATPSLMAAFSSDRSTLTVTRIAVSGVVVETVAPQVLANSALAQFLHRRASTVAVYSAPPGHGVPAREMPPAAPEFLFVLKGDVTLALAQAGSRGIVRCEVGSATLLESGAIAERAGPEGYTALRLRLESA